MPLENVTYFDEDCNNNTGWAYQESYSFFFFTYFTMYSIVNIVPLNNSTVLDNNTKHKHCPSESGTHRTVVYKQNKNRYSVSVLIHNSDYSITLTLLYTLDFFFVMLIWLARL